LAVNYALLSTTSTALGRVRGFTITLLYLLFDGGGRCCDLAERCGKSQNYVWRYLKNMERYGLALKNGDFWFLTDSGVEFVKYLDIVYNNIIDYRKKVERKSKENKKKVESNQPKSSKQIPISLWLQNSGLDSVEKEVVEVLLKHYNETGSKFILVKDQFELAEKLKANPSEVLEALKNLRQDNVIYLYRSDIEGYWKIGLKTNFLRILESEILNTQSSTFINVHKRGQFLCSRKKSIPPSKCYV
jgi:Mn-dependent DtxR family transcriptional regulator